MLGRKLLEANGGGEAGRARPHNDHIKFHRLAWGKFRSVIGHSPRCPTDLVSPRALEPVRGSCEFHRARTAGMAATTAPTMPERRQADGTNQAGSSSATIGGLGRLHAVEGLGRSAATAGGL